MRAWFSNDSSCNKTNPRSFHSGDLIILPQVKFLLFCCRLFYFATVFSNINKISCLVCFKKTSLKKIIITILLSFLVSNSFSLHQFWFAPFSTCNILTFSIFGLNHFLLAIFSSNVFVENNFKKY